jgi:hypothetical protein
VIEEKISAGTSVALVDKAETGGQKATMHREPAGIEDRYRWARPGFEADFATRTAVAADEWGRRRSFAQAEPNYRAGFLAGHNLQYAGHTFEDIEPELRHEFETSIGAASERARGSTHWERLREEIRAGFHAARRCPYWRSLLPSPC